MSDPKPAFTWRAPPDWIWRAIVFLLALGILVLITTRWSRWESNSRWQTTDDAYLRSDLTPIAAKVSGYVRSMPVQDYERVREGQQIAQIVDDDYRATVDQLTASVAAAAAQIEALGAQRELQSANVQPAKASVAAVEANVEQNKRDLRVVREAPLPRVLLLVSFLRLTILSTALVIPQFLQTVRGFRALEVGDTLA